MSDGCWEQLIRPQLVLAPPVNCPTNDALPIWNSVQKQVTNRFTLFTVCLPLLYCYEQKPRGQVCMCKAWRYNRKNNSHSSNHTFKKRAAGGTVNETACAACVKQFDTFGWPRCIHCASLCIQRSKPNVALCFCHKTVSLNAHGKVYLVWINVSLESTSVVFITLSLVASPSLHRSYLLNPSFLLSINLSVIEYADFTWLTPITPLALSTLIASSWCTMAAKMISQSSACSIDSYSTT